MKTLIRKLVAIGADLSTRNTFKTALNVLGINPKSVDRLYVELKNSINRGGFRKVPRDRRVLFIPQCLRNSRKCRAKLTDAGYACVNCCNCKAHRVKGDAEKLGYRAFIVPGGHMAFEIIKKTRPRAVVGIACLKELVIAAEAVRIPAQGIELKRDGCVDTDVDMKDVLEVLRV